MINESTCILVLSIQHHNTDSIYLTEDMAWGHHSKERNSSRGTEHRKLLKTFTITEFLTYLKGKKRVLFIKINVKLKRLS
jgi:hypothetical protein